MYHVIILYLDGLISCKLYVVTHIQKPIDRKVNAGHLGAFRYSKMIRLDTYSVALEFPEVKGCQARIEEHFNGGGVNPNKVWP